MQFDDNDRIISVAEVARLRGVSRRAVLDESRRNPLHPPPLAISGNHPRSRKGFRAGAIREYERLRDQRAEEEQRAALLRAAQAKQEVVT